jgi:hypothetical protein
MNRFKKKSAPAPKKPVPELGAEFSILGKRMRVFGYFASSYDYRMYITLAYREPNGELKKEHYPLDTFDAFTKPQ